MNTDLRQLRVERVEVAPKQIADSAGVKFPPPLIFLGGLLFGRLLDAWFNTRYLTDEEAGVAGSILLVAGVLLFAYALQQFHRVGNAVRPDRPVGTLLRTGPYRFTRNPIYIAMALVYLGIAILFESFWSPFLLPVVLSVVHHAVVKREEAYLLRRFGSSYSIYKSTVSRWL